MASLIQGAAFFGARSKSPEERAVIGEKYGIDTSEGAYIASDQATAHAQQEARRTRTAVAIGAAAVGGYFALGALGGSAALGESGAALGAGEGAVSAASADAAFAGWSPTLTAADMSYPAISESVITPTTASGSGFALPSWANTALTVGSKLFGIGDAGAASNPRPDTQQQNAYRTSLLPSLPPSAPVRSNEFAQLIPLALIVIIGALIFRLLRR